MRQEIRISVTTSPLFHQYAISALKLASYSRTYTSKNFRDAGELGQDHGETTDLLFH